MTTAIRAVGGYAPLDDEGFVCSQARAPDCGQLRRLVHELGQAFAAHYGPRLHSAYLRGSLTLGHAPSTIGDVDAFVLLHPTPADKPRWRPMDWTGNLSRQLRERHSRPIDFDLHESTYNPQMERDYPQLAMLIALHSYCIVGTNLKSKLRRRYRPGRQMLTQLRWLAHDLENFRQSQAPDHAEFRALIKVVLRSGFELVMAREGRYTTALYFCVLSFARHYPIHAGLAWRVLECFVNPGPATPQAQAVVLQLANFIVSEARVQMPDADYLR